MATYAKLLNGLTDLGIHKMQEHLDYYIDLVNKGQKSFSDALEELKRKIINSGQRTPA